MSGLAGLSDDEKLEMIEDARDVERGKVFLAARMKSQEGTLDEYIDFLSENMGLVEFVPSRRITTKYRL